MLRSLFRVRALMVLIIIVALAFWTKFQLIDRPANQRRVEYYMDRAQAHASAAIDLEEWAKIFPNPFAEVKIRDHRALERLYLEAAQKPDKPTNVMDEESNFLVRNHARLNQEIAMQRQRISDRSND